MSVFIFLGGYKIVEKSGVGKAIHHQINILNHLQIPVVHTWKDSSTMIHLNTVFPDSFFAAIRAKPKHKKVIVYGHSTMQDFRNSFHGSNFMAPFFKFWIKRCYNRGDIVITPTVYSKGILESYGLKPPIYALSNGIDTEFFHYSPEFGQRFREKYSIASDQKVVISVGHYIKRKGILDFLDLAERMPDTKFIWFGHTNLKMVPLEISRRVAHPPKNVLFPGFVSREELRDAYCGTDCFAFLSHEETEGIVILEALACQTATVVRNIAVYQPWLRDGKEVLMGQNVEAFEKRIREIFRREIDMRTYALRLAQSRSMENMAEKMKKIYRELGCPDGELSL